MLKQAFINYMEGMNLFDQEKLSCPVALGLALILLGHAP